MSGFSEILAISATGLHLERTRLEVAAENLANAHSTVGAQGQPYRPLRVFAETAEPATSIDGSAASIAPGSLHGVENVEIRPMAVGPRLDFDPGNPLADSKGFVAVPAINVAEEMLTVLTAVRGYEANARVIAAARAMATRALSIGSNQT